MADAAASNTNVMENSCQQSGNCKGSIYDVRKCVNVKIRDFMANNDRRADVNIV